MHEMKQMQLWVQVCMDFTNYNVGINVYFKTMHVQTRKHLQTFHSNKKWAFQETNWKAMGPQ